MRGRSPSRSPILAARRRDKAGRSRVRTSGASYDREAWSDSSWAVKLSLIDIFEEDGVDGADANQHGAGLDSQNPHEQNRVGLIRDPAGRGEPAAVQDLPASKCADEIDQCADADDQSEERNGQLASLRASGSIVVVSVDRLMHEVLLIVKVIGYHKI